MHRIIGVGLLGCVLIAPLAATGAFAQIQLPQPMQPKLPPVPTVPRPNAVRPNSQNLMEGPSYWTPGQRQLNVPSANANPTLRENNPYNRTVPPSPPLPPPAPKP